MRVHEPYQLAVAAPGIKWVSTTPCRWWCSPAVRELICLQESAGIHKKQRHFLFATAYVCMYIYIYTRCIRYIYPWVVRFPERNIHMVSAMHGDNVHWTWTHGRCHSTGTPQTDASMGVSTTNVFLVDDYRFKKKLFARMTSLTVILQSSNVLRLRAFLKPRAKIFGKT